MPFTTSAVKAILSSQFSPSNYIGLSTSTPNQSGGNFSEPGPTTGYARAKIGELDTSIDRQVANKEIIFMFESLANCGTFTHFGVFTSPSGGTPTFYGELEQPLTVDRAGYVPLIRAHEFIVGLDTPALNTSY